MPNRRLPVSWIQIRSFFTTMGTFLPRWRLVLLCLELSDFFLNLKIHYFQNLYQQLPHVLHAYCKPFQPLRQHTKNISSSILVTQDRAKQGKWRQDVALRRPDKNKSVFPGFENYCHNTGNSLAGFNVRHTKNIYERMDRLDMQTEEYKGKTMVGTAITNFKYDFQNSEIFT